MWYIYICICICIYVWYIYVYVYVYMCDIYICICIHIIYIIIFLAISLYLLDFLCQRSWISEARRFRAGEAAAEHLRPTGGDPLQELGRGTGDIWGWESHGWNMGKYGKRWENMGKLVNFDGSNWDFYDFMSSIFCFHRWSGWKSSHVGVVVLDGPSPISFSEETQRKMTFDANQIGIRCIHFKF